MDLWTEYEGVTIDSAFALRKLLQPEGRSAFFSTTNAKGEAVLARIIECHFDQDEILARWRGVQALGHPNFLRIERFGHFRVKASDGTAVYAVFERVDENLGEVLERGHLSSAAASEIGLSVSSALETLHANGFVHEHIDTRNIYAVGNTVKLRSDCIREAPEGGAGVEARRGDIHQLAVVLTQVLLGSSTGSSATRQPMLPRPFDDIVCNGLNGTWGLAEIKAALGTPEPVKAEPRRIVTVEGNLPEAECTSKTEDALAATAIPRDSSARVLSFEKSAEYEQEHEETALPDPEPTTFSGPAERKRAPMEVPVIFGISERDFRRWKAAGALVLALILMVWFFVHRSSHRTGAAMTAPATSAPTAGELQTTGTPENAVTYPAAPVMGATPVSGAQWRVVAFTYRSHEQAQKRAASLAQKNARLQPVVFSPTGKAPWLVTIGGVLQRDAAYALARKARSLGLPRDTYAQNYRMR